MVGHLVNLEAYPALPLLLWLADRAVARGGRADIFALAFGTSCVVLAGHPQIPAYAVAAALLYVVWRGRTKLSGAIALGIGATMIAWWPMLLLIRRSSRALPLDRAANDVTLPYHRLLGLIAPGVDGWPAGVAPVAWHLFAGYSPYFWGTFAYIGILPLAAAVILAAICVQQRRWPESRWLFLAVIGIVALLGALPLLDPLRDALHLTIFRSPARLLYVCAFSLAVAFGAGMDALGRFPRRFALAAIAICLVFHGWELGHVSRLFLTPGPLHPLAIPEFASELGCGRIAVSRVLDLRLPYDHDDAGGFDAIFLATTYRALLALTGANPRLNEEVLDASTGAVPALQATGVEFVVPWPERKDLELVRPRRDSKCIACPIRRRAPTAGRIPITLWPRALRHKPVSSIFWRLMIPGGPLKSTGHLRRFGRRRRSAWMYLYRRAIVWCGSRITRRGEQPGHCCRLRACACWDSW